MKSLFRSGVRCPVAFLVIAFALLCAATRCDQRIDRGGPPEKMSIACPATYNGALIQVALAKNYFAEEGLEVTAQSYGYGKVALDAVVDGKADLAAAGDTPFMLAVMAGKKVAAVAAIETSNRNTAIVCRRDRGIATPSDLRGKRVAVTRGTTSQFFVDLFLAAYGIGEREVRIVDLRPDEIRDALKTGRVDAASSWNPLLTELQDDMGEKGSTFHQEMLYTETFCAIVRQDYAREHPEAIRRFLRALIKAEGFVRGRPEEARRIVAAYVRVDEATLARVWDIYNFTVDLGESLIIDLEDQTWWAIEKGLTAGKTMPDYIKFIYVDGLQKVRPETVAMMRK